MMRRPLDMLRMSRMRIFARGSPGCCHSGMGAGWSSVYTPRWMSVARIVPLRLLPMDQLSSGVVIVMPGPYRSPMICPLYVTTNAAVIPESNAAATAASTFALSTPAGHGAPDGRSPIGHGMEFAGGSALFTVTGVKYGSVFPTGSPTHPWLPISRAMRTVPFGSFTDTDLVARSITGFPTFDRISYGAVKYPTFSATKSGSSPVTNTPEHM